MRDEVVGDAVEDTSHGGEVVLRDEVDDEDFAAVGRVFDRIADHLVTRHPESEIRG